MKSEVTLLLICMLFSKALSLTCQQCSTVLSDTCEETTCPDQCLTVTTSMYMGGSKMSHASLKTCSNNDSCISGSLNLGIMQISSNVKCCSTNLCNTEILPALPKQAPNGKKCYTCDFNGCSKTISCEGTEDRCITATAQQGGNTITMKGCASKIVCAASGSTDTGLAVSKLQCCEGSLCNGAESFTLSFILMIVPLLSSILFY